jgi:hypothetical protein
MTGLEQGRGRSVGATKKRGNRSKTSAVWAVLAEYLAISESQFEIFRIKPRHGMSESGRSPS